MSLAAIAKLLGGIKRAANPAASLEQKALVQALQDYNAQRYIPKPAAEALAIETALKDYAEPHDRRQFFRNALGIRGKAEQIEATKLAGQFPAELQDEISIQEIADMGSSGAARFLELEQKYALDEDIYKIMDETGLERYPVAWGKEFGNFDKRAKAIMDALDNAPPSEPVSEDSFLTPWLKRYRR